TKHFGSRREHGSPECRETCAPFRRRRRGGDHLLERVQRSGLIGDRCLDQGISLDGEIASASSVIAAQSPVEILDADEACEEKHDEWKSPQKWSAPAST